MSGTTAHLRKVIPFTMSYHYYKGNLTDQSIGVIKSTYMDKE